MNVVGALKRKAEGLEEAAQLAATTGLDHWQKATTSLDTFGFTVGRFTVAMGVVPKIPTSISGSIANIREDGLKQIIAAHAGETLLVTMLEALDCRQAPLEAAATTPDRRSISPRSPSSCIGCTRWCPTFLNTANGTKISASPASASLPADGDSDRCHHRRRPRRVTSTS